MKAVIIGGGPAGLYTALLLKQADPAHQVTVLERNRADDTFGWGVVFSDQTLENFRVADEATYRAITENFAHWDDIDVVVRGRRITSGGHGFSGIGRQALLGILQGRAAELGVDLRFSTDVRGTADLEKLGLGGGRNRSCRRREQHVPRGIRPRPRAGFGHADHPHSMVCVAAYSSELPILRT